MENIGGTKKDKEKKIIDVSFGIGLLLKGLFALGEILAGAALLFLTPDRLNKLISWAFKTELTEDPSDWIVNRFVIFGHTFTAGDQRFAMFYLISHGAIKLVTILLLWRKKLWAYPLSVIVFIGFIIYQMYHFALTHSIALILLTVLDIVMIVLTILEYRQMKRYGK